MSLHVRHITLTNCLDESNNLLIYEVVIHLAFLNISIINKQRFGHSEEMANNLESD